MSSYIMQGPGEAERIRLKTQNLLTRQHLDWIGLRAGHTFVDFGCATGEVIREAAAISDPAIVVGLDSSDEMLAAASAESNRVHIANVGYIRTLIGGVESVPIANGAFDHAWTRFFLEYQRDPGGVVGEMKRVVRPGGKVSLLDLEGNFVWHFPLPPDMRRDMDEVIADLATTGFDPHVGAKLEGFARAVGLVDIRSAVEPCHRIVGQPDEQAADAWRRKIQGIRDNYLSRLFPEKQDKAAFFDRFLEFILSAESMTWSLLHLVQGTKPPGVPAP